MESSLKRVTRQGSPRLPSSFTRKALCFVAGACVILAGLVMLATPGPGLLAVCTGLAILAVEFRWARYWLQQIRRKTKRLRQRMRGRRAVRRSNQDDSGYLSGGGRPNAALLNDSALDEPEAMKWGKSPDTPKDTR